MLKVAARKLGFHTSLFTKTTLWKSGLCTREMFHLKSNRNSGAKFSTHTYKGISLHILESMHTGFSPCFCCSHTAADWPGSGSQWPGPRSPARLHSGLQSAKSDQCSTRWGSQSYPHLNNTRGKQWRRNWPVYERVNTTTTSCTVLVKYLRYREKMPINYKKWDHDTICKRHNYLSCLRFLDYQSF